jgi:hypothetical protein
LARRGATMASGWLPRISVVSIGCTNSFNMWGLFAGCVSAV